jgi:hypothetical protein
VIDVRLDSWLLNEAREKEKVEVVRVRPPGLNEESSLPGVTLPEMGESLAGTAGAPSSEKDVSKYCGGSVSFKATIVCPA